MGPLSGASITLTLDEDESVEGQLRFEGSVASEVKFSIAAGPENGKIVFSDKGFGLFKYTPDPDWHGTDEVQFTVVDGTRTGSGIVTFIVDPVRDAPQTFPASLLVTEDVESSGNLTGEDADGDALTYSIYSSPEKGTVSLEPSTGTFVYSPNSQENGLDSFSFRVSDGWSYSNVSTVTINITPVNDAPIAEAASITILEDTIHNGTLAGSDPEGAALSFAIASNPSKGILVLNTLSGAFTYTPNGNAHGDDVTLAPYLEHRKPPV